MTYKYVVHELIPIEEQTPEEIRNWKVIENDDTQLHPSEVLGNQIQMNADGVWNL